MKQHLYSIALVMATTLAFGVTLSAAINLGDDIDTDTQRDASQAASAQDRLDRARADMCGVDGWAEQPDGSTVCLPHAKPADKVAQVWP